MREIESWISCNMARDARNHCGDNMGVHTKVTFWILGLRLMATSLYEETRA